MALVVRLARALDWAESLDESGTVPIALNRWRFRQFALQTDAGGAITIRDEADRLVMIAGLHPSSGEFVEAWWTVGPGMRANARRAIPLWKRLFLRVCEDAAPLTVRVYVPAHSVAGHRLAPVFGFHRAFVCAGAPGVFQVWERRFECRQP